MSTLHFNAADSIFHNEDNNEFHFDVSQISFLRNHHSHRIGLQEVVWTNLHPTIHKYNKYISFTENGGAILTAALSEGYYNISELLLELKTAMELVGILTYTVTYNNITRKISISCGPDTVALQDVNNNIYDILGFIGSESGTSITSTNVVDIGGTNTFIVVVPSIDPSTFHSGGRKIMAEVPVVNEVGFLSHYMTEHVVYEKMKQYSPLIKIILYDGKSNVPYVLPKNIDMSFKFILQDEQT